MVGGRVKVKRAGAPPPALLYKEERARSAEDSISHFALPDTTPTQCAPYAKPPVATWRDLCYSALRKPHPILTTESK